MNIPVWASGEDKYMHRYAKIWRKFNTSVPITIVRQQMNRKYILY
jgi:hypothetical protein